MTTTYTLTPAGSDTLHRWLAAVARDEVRGDVIESEVCDILTDRVAGGESLVYELGQCYTITGRPETITFHSSDIVAHRARVSRT